MKNTQRKTVKSYITLKQRITAAFTAVVMLAQICIPTVALATTAWGGNFESRLASELNSPMIELINDLAAPEAYKGAYFIHKSTINHTTLDAFYNDYKKGKPAQKPKFIGDSFVQSRLIRAQYRSLMGRYFFSGVLRSEETEAFETNRLYEVAKTYAEGNNLTLGNPLGNASPAQDMIWPELKQVNGKSYLVPVVHLSQNTLNNKLSDHLIQFDSNATFAGIQLDFATLITGYNSVVTGLYGIINNQSSIKSPGNLTLSGCEKTPQISDPYSTSILGNIHCSGTIANLGGTIDVEGTLDIYGKDVINKTLVVPYKDKNGEGTRLGRVADINAGNIQIFADGNIEFVGASAVSDGKFFLNAANDINIAPLTTHNNSQSQQGDWKVNKSTTDLLMSRLAAEDTLSLIAGGVINITASELISSRGGIELLAGEGIHILDELEQTSIQKEDRKGKTKGTSSEFRTEAVRAILSAGKGVLLDSEHGDVVLRATKLTSTEGTQVTARNGKVHLLMTKELEQLHLQTVKKSTWTIKTHTVNVEHENNIQNAIVGGLQVQAMYGINVEYTGKEGATLKEQIEEYRKMPGMEWMAELYDQAVVEGGQSVNWEVMEEVHKELKKTKRNLSPAAMAIIAICVAVAMGPMGAQLVGSSGGGLSAAIASAAPNATLGAAFSAGAMTLTTQAVQSLAAGNNLRETLSAMDSSESLRSLAVSMVTAGAMEAAQFEMFEVPETSPVNMANLAKQASQAVIDSTISAGVSTLAYGGNFDAFKDAFVSSLAQAAVNKLGKEMAEKIGAAYDTPENLDIAMKYIAHAASGCIIGAAKAEIDDTPDTDGACYIGAGGAVIGEIIASQYRSNEDIQNAKKAVEDFIKENGDEVAWLKTQGYSSQQIIEHFSNVDNFYATVKRLDQLKQTGVDLAKLGAAFGAFYAGADEQQINIAASAGANAAENNALSIFAAMSVVGMAIDALGVDLSGAIGPTEQMMMAGADGVMELALEFQEGIDEQAGHSLITDPQHMDDPLHEPAVMGGVIAGVLDAGNVLGIGADAFLRLSADFHAGNLNLTSSSTMERLKGLIQDISNMTNIAFNLDDFTTKMQGALISAGAGDRRAQAEVARFTTNMAISAIAGGAGASRTVVAVDRSVARLYKLSEEGKLDADKLFRQEGFSVEAISQTEFKVISIPSQIPKLPNAWTEARFGHVWEGNYDKTYKKLQGGMHTVEGLKAFIRETATDDRIFTELIVTDFQSGLNLTNNILKQQLPNGVIRVHLPNEGINKSVRQDAIVFNNQGEKIQGIKTLFPLDWTEADIKSAGQSVINQQGGIIKSKNLSGEYKGVKVNVFLDEKSGIIKTIYPSWDQ